MNARYRSSPLLLTLLAALALAGPAVRAKDHDDDESGKSTARVQFSDPAKPGTLKLTMPWAEARITATDGKEVVVTSTLDQKGRKEVDSEGFRRIDEDVTFEVVEKNNVAVVTIAGDNQWAAQGAEFDIQVPRNTNLVLRTEAGGDIQVDGVEGDLDISSMNGDVKLRDIGSSAVVNTMNGEISATFKRAPTKPVSFSSMNGEIDLRLPTDTKANLRMRTHNGSIRTNFPENALQAKTERSVHVSADARLEARADADAEGEGRSRGGGNARDVDREIAREVARADREQARIAKEVAKAVAQANQIAASVTASLDHDGSIPPVPPVSPVPHINFGGKSIVGTLNGGGVDIKLTSMNGTITLREAK